MIRVLLLSGVVKLSPRAYCVAAAVAFLIAGSGTVSAKMEDVGQSATAFPDDGVAQGPALFRDGDGLSSRDFTSLSVGGNMSSAVGSDNGPDGRDGGGPLPMPVDELNADYSSSTLDGLFPPAVNGGSGDFDSWIMNGQTLFGDSDSFSGFSVHASGLSLLGLSTLGPPEDRPRKGRSHCSSDGSQVGVQCELEGDLGSLTSQGAGSNGADQPAPQSLNLPDLSGPVGGNDLSQKMTTAQMAWQWDVTHGIFPPACCAFDVTPAVVDGILDVTSDVVSPPSDFAPIPPGLSYSPGTGQGPVVPEIPQWAMLLIGFGGLALVGWRRLRGSGGAGSAFGTR
jgi:hypothetical protein